MAAAVVVAAEVVAAIIRRRTTLTAVRPSSRRVSWTPVVCARRSGSIKSGNINYKKTNRPRRRQWYRRARPQAAMVAPPIPYIMPVIILPHTNTNPICILAINLAFPPLFLRPIVATTLLIYR